MYISLYIFALFSDHSGCSKNNPRQISLLNFFLVQKYSIWSVSWVVSLPVGFLGKKHVFGVVANLVNPAQPLIATEKHADYERPAVGVSLKDTRVMLSEFAT